MSDIDPHVLLDEDRLRALRQAAHVSLCRQSLFAFIKKFWPTIIDEDPVWNWHIPFICQELEEILWCVIARKPKKHDLIINVPPGSTKTTICSVMFPVWAWVAQIPPDRYRDCVRRDGINIRFITASYAQDISLKSSVLSRRIIRSPEFKAFFPEIKLQTDQDTKSDYANDKKGSRFSTSVGSRVMGEHAHIIIVDDPVDPTQAQSELLRNAANGWLDITLSSRKVSKAVTPTVLIMQRLHQNDCTGHVLDKSDKPVRHIRLPGDDSYDISPTGLREKYINGLLDPSRLDRGVLDESLKNLTPYGYAGQIGQDPKPKEGALFQEEWFEIIAHRPQKDKGGVWVRGWDLAATQKKSSAWTAGALVRLMPDGVFIIENMVRLKGTPGTVKEIIYNTAVRDGLATRISIPQDPGQAGVAQKQDYAAKLAGFDVRFSPESGSKEGRAVPFSAQAEAGNVKMVRGPWNRDYLAELSFFPAGTFADQVDATTRAFTELTKRRSTQLIPAAPEPIELAEVC